MTCICTILWAHHQLVKWILGPWSTGAHFTNNFSITIQMWLKFHFALIQILKKWSLQYLAHDTTAELNEISIEFELWWKIVSEMGPRPRFQWSSRRSGERVANISFPYSLCSQITDIIFVDITFALNRCHRSWVAVTPFQYEWDPNDPNYSLAKSKIFDGEINERVLVTPTAAFTIFIAHLTQHSLEILVYSHDDCWKCQETVV